MKTDYKKAIINKLKKSGKKPVTFKELKKSCKIKDFDKFVRAVEIQSNPFKPQVLTASGIAQLKSPVSEQ